MVKTSTLDLLLQYAYGELSDAKATCLEYEIMDSRSLQNEALELKKMMALLNKAILAPEDKAEKMLW